MIELFAELSSGRDSDICLRAADLRELEDIHRELRQLQEQIASALGRSGPAARAPADHFEDIVTDLPVIPDPLLHPAFRLGDPGPGQGE